MCLKVIKQEEMDYIRQIREENMKLKEANRFKDKELEQKATETEAVLFFGNFIIFCNISAHEKVISSYLLIALNFLNRSFRF